MSQHWVKLCDTLPGFKGKQRKWHLFNRNDCRRNKKKLESGSNSWKNADQQYSQQRLGRALLEKGVHTTMCMSTITRDLLRWDCTGEQG
jgi:hypothetical protein